MVTAEEPFDPRQLVIVAAAVGAVWAIAVRQHVARTAVRWHCAAALIAVNALYGFIRGRGTWVAFIVQPIIVLLVAGGLAPRTAREWAVVAVYGVGTVAGAVAAPMPDVVGTGVALYLAYLVSWEAVGAALCAAEAAAVATLFAASDTDEVTIRSEHYTWWSITLFAVWDVLLFVDAYLGTRLASPFAGLTATVSVVVAIGVLYMSANGCTLLSDAQDEAGDGLYIVGNFLMHYYPLVRLFTYQPALRYSALVRGAGLGVIYALTYPATDVYGCSKPLPAYTPSLMASVGLAVAGLLWVLHNRVTLMSTLRGTA